MHGTRDGWHRDRRPRAVATVGVHADHVERPAVLEQSGLARFANDKHGEPVTPTVLMQAGDPAFPGERAGASNEVGRENDMIALSPDGRYLFTLSENANPSEAGPAPNGSDGITRLTLKGRTPGGRRSWPTTWTRSGDNLWQRVDGMKWYPLRRARRRRSCCSTARSSQPGASGRSTRTPATSPGSTGSATTPTRGSVSTGPATSPSAARPAVRGPLSRAVPNDARGT